MSKARDLADLPQGDGDLTVDGDLITDGKVGIGTSSPDTLLQAANTSANDNYISYEIGNSTVSEENYGGFGIYELGGLKSTFTYARDGSASTKIASLGNTSLRFDTNGTERMRIDSSGNVGIGTSSPVGKEGATSVVQLEKSVADAEFQVKASGAWFSSYSTNTNGSGYGGWRHYNSAGTRTEWVYTAGNSGILFGTNTQERMRITPAGNALIGTTTDNGVDKLQVNGAISASNYNAAFVNNTAFTGNTLTISPLSLGIPAAGVLEFSVNIGVNNSGAYSEASVVVIVNFSSGYPQYGFNNSHTVICNMGRNETTTAPSITVSTTRATAAGANNGALVLTLGSTYSTQTYSCQVRRLTNLVSY